MRISYKCGTSDTTSICVSSNPVEIFSDPQGISLDLDDKKGTLFLLARRVDLIFFVKHRYSTFCAGGPEISCPIYS